LHKRPEELAALRKAAEISIEAHLLAMKTGRPRRVRARARSADRFLRSVAAVAAVPVTRRIVGAGDNATILHYIENRCADRGRRSGARRCRLRVRSLHADITRTWPASGKFTAPQRRVYEIVLATQLSAIAMVKPGVTIDEIHDHCVRELTEGMIALGYCPVLQTNGSRT